MRAIHLPTTDESPMASPERSPAQVAYEAYAESTKWHSAITGAALPPWAKVPALARDAWAAAASAVKQQVRHGG